MILAFLLLAGLVPFMIAPSGSATATESEGVRVMFHFKDSAGETIDFASINAPYALEGDELVATIDEQGRLGLTEGDHVAIYENYATFGGRQRDITNECSFDAEKATVSIPKAYLEGCETLAVVFELPPSHSAYDSLILSQLDIEPLELTVNGKTAVLESDVPDILAAENKDAGITPFAAAFPGTADKRYQLNPHTRLENFDVDMPRKQEAYGFPSDMVGSYGFGVLFGSSQRYVDGVSTGTNHRDSVLDKTDESYDEIVEELLAQTIASRNGSDATFAHSQFGDSYRSCYVTTGQSYQDAGYGPGSAPNNQAMAHGTCGSANVGNGYGAIEPNPDGDNYIAYKGTYRGPQSRYEGWYKFYYKLDARSGATHQTFQDVVGYLLVEPTNTGSAQLVKTSTDTSISTANGNYSLKNAVFAAFPDRASAKAAAEKAAKNPWKDWQAARTWANSNASFTMVTKDNGKSAIVKDIEGGTYYVCELFAPAGFRLNSQVKTAEVEATGDEDDVCVIEFADVPERGAIDLLKQSRNPEVSDGHPGYTLAGAVYGVYTDAQCTKLFGEIRTALDKNAQGYGRLDAMPIGSYWVREIKRPLEGYALDHTIYPVSVSDGITARVNLTAVDDRPKLNPCSIFIQKKDAQSGQNAAQGGASLGDARFRIDYYTAKNASASTLASLQPKATWVVRTNDEGAFRLDCAEQSFTHQNPGGIASELPYKVSGPAFYKLSDGRIGMPIGTYSIQEVQAPRGYLLDDTIHIRHINDEDSDEEILATFEAEQDGDTIVNRVARADLRLAKRADGGSKLAGIPFKLTSKSTGEWHILVTDKNGTASTQSTPAHPHSTRTNANDEQFIGPDGSFQMPLVLDMDALDASAGTWFGLGVDGQPVDVNDNFGALPFDTYELEELRCPANLLFNMIRDEVVVDESDEHATIDLGTLNNTSTGRPSLRTSAYDGLANDPADSAISADTEAVIIDRVTYSGLEPGVPYTILGVLMDKATGKPFLVGEQEVTSEIEFTPIDYNGYVNVEFSFDASGITEQTDLVIFETLRRNEMEIASHRDLTDRKQTIAVSPITIGTTARDAASGTHEGIPAETITIIDTVSYQGLTPGAEYQLSAVLMNKADNTPWLVDGQTVLAEHSFIPEASSGTVDVEITIPGLNLDGASLVVFESLAHNDIEVALHADIDDEGQTVSYGYPDQPLPPTGGNEEPATPQTPQAPEQTASSEGPKPNAQTTRLAQTGDDTLTVACLAALVGAAGATAAVIAYRKRR